MVEVFILIHTTFNINIPGTQTKSPSKAAGMFSGTQDKCATCGKTAYPLEKVFNFFTEHKILHFVN